MKVFIKKKYHNEDSKHPKLKIVRAIFLNTQMKDVLIIDVIIIH